MTTFTDLRRVGWFQDGDWKVSLLSPKPGDILLVTTPDHLTPEQAELLKEHAVAALGADAPKILVLSGGVQMRLLSRDTFDAVQ